MVRKFEHGGNIYHTDTSYLDYSANINPLGLSPAVEKAITAHISDLIHYPDPDGKALKLELAAYYGLSEERLILGNGAAELLYLWFHAVRPARVLIPVPSFSEYERAALSSGASVDFYPLRADDQFGLDWDALWQAVAEADGIILGNPNNPTGNLLTRSELLPFLEKAERAGKYVILDESFLDFRADSALYSTADLAGVYPHLFVIHSLTKFYAIPGLRLGFGCLDEGLVARLEAQTDVWHVNSLAQSAGIAALRDRDYQEASRRLLQVEQAFMKEALAAIPGIMVYGGSVNFLLCDVRETGLTSETLTARMRDAHILIRDCSNYPGLNDYYIRLAIRGREENKNVISSLKKCLLTI